MWHLHPPPFIPIKNEQPNESRHLLPHWAINGMPISMQYDSLTEGLSEWIRHVILCSLEVTKKARPEQRHSMTLSTPKSNQNIKTKTSTTKFAKYQHKNISIWWSCVSFFYFGGKTKKTSHKINCPRFPCPFPQIETHPSLRRIVAPLRLWIIHKPS